MLRRTGMLPYHDIPLVHPVPCPKPAIAPFIRFPPQNVNKNCSNVPRGPLDLGF
jgi:hypothetical protein